MWILHSELAEKGSPAAAGWQLGIQRARERGARRWEPFLAAPHMHGRTGPLAPGGGEPSEPARLLPSLRADHGGACLALDTGRAPACEATQPAPRVVPEPRSARPSCRTRAGSPGAAY